jgi:hypothetical protein
VQGLLYMGLLPKVAALLDAEAPGPVAAALLRALARICRCTARRTARPPHAVASCTLARHASPPHSLATPAHHTPPATPSGDLRLSCRRPCVDRGTRLDLIEQRSRSPYTRLLPKAVQARRRIRGGSVQLRGSGPGTARQVRQRRAAAAVRRCAGLWRRVPGYPRRSAGAGAGHGGGGGNCGSGDCGGGGGMRRVGVSRGAASVRGVGGHVCRAGPGGPARLAQAARARSAAVSRGRRSSRAGWRA